MDEEKKPYKNPLAGLDLHEVQVLLQEKLAGMPHGYKLPYMQWYEDDFKSSDGVEEMAPIARLMYRQLLAKAWSSKEAPYLPSDKDKLFRLADCPDEGTWKKHSGSVLAMFVRTRDKKRYFHPRQLLDYASQIIRISANTSNGKKGGRPPKPKETNDKQETQLETETEPNQNPNKRQSEPEPEAKQESKPTQKTQLDFDTGEDDFLETEEGDSDMNLKAFKAEMISAGVERGVIISGYDNTWADLKLLTVAHGSAAVVNDFGEFLDEGGEYPKGALVAYKWVAADRLNAETPVLASAKDPEVVSLARELSYLSDGVVAFMDKQRIRLAEVLKEFSAAEIQQAFKTWLGDQDTSDPKNVSFLAGKFVQIVDSLCYSARRKKQESDAALIARTRRAAELQQEAEAEREEAEKKRLAEENIYDPVFGDLENVVQ